MWRTIDPQKIKLPSVEEALPGRTERISVPGKHYVLDSSLEGPFEPELQFAMFGMGCYWGVEKLFWQQQGVVSTAVGYSAGISPNPSYEEVCSGLTGHNEVVRVVFDPEKISYQELLQLFWQNHNPCTGMQQANDVGTQYRSGIYTFDEAQHEMAEQSKALYQARLVKEGKKEIITTEIITAKEFYFAEAYHQQYLAKNPNGYCNAQTCTVTGLPEY